MIRNTEGHVLLVRRSIDGRWYLPGVGVQRRETMIDAVTREVREETGLTVSKGDARVFGVYWSFFEGKSDHIVVCTSTAAGTLQPDGIEIDAATFWPLSDLPANVSPGTRRRLAELASGLTTPVLTTW
jgi:ADP-ribose pyrophosphatase YjhB (NUDIX family)